jgi:effector-binding domain-containing protein
MEYDVTIRTVPRQLVAAARQRTTLKMISQEIGDLLSRPWVFLKDQSELRAGGHNVAIYWDDTGEGSIEVGVQVVALFEAPDDVICSATPEGTVATTAHVGPYNQLRVAHKAVRNWCQQNRREFVLPFWEVYGDWQDDPAKLRTDIYYLLR